MRLWVASRRPLFLVVACIGFVALVVVFGSSNVPVPSLGEGSLLPVPFAVFLPLAPTAVVVFCLSNTHPSIEAVAVRRVGWLDGAGLIVFAGFALVSCYAAHVLWDADASVQGARNLVGYLGIGVACLVMFNSRAASFLPAAFAVIVSTFGRTVGVSEAWWAWPLAAIDVPLAAAQVGILFLTAIVLLGVVGRPQM